MNYLRVAITGIGILVPGANNKTAFWNKIKNKDLDLSIKIDTFEDLVKYRYASLLDKVEMDNVPPIVMKQTDIGTQFAMSATLKALEDSDITIDENLSDHLGFFFGTEFGGLSFAEIEYRKYIEKGYRYLSPYLSIGMFYSAPIGQLSILLKTKGYSKTYCSGECSSSTAIGEAYRVIQDGLAKVIVAGGYEKANTESSSLVYSHKNLLAYGLSEDNIPVTKPYSAESEGMILSDGAGMITLESYDEAQKRGTHIYGEIVAYSQGFSSHHDSEVIKRIIEVALNEAQLKPNDINFIHGGGIGINVWDAKELTPLKDIFGENAIIGVPGNMFGNFIGALGSIGVVTSLLSMENDEFYTISNPQAISFGTKNYIYVLILNRSLEGNITAIILKK